LNRSDLNDNKPLIETSETPETTSVNLSIERPPALEPLNNKAYNEFFTCECEKGERSACEGLLFYKEHEGKRYCV
jgi:hypothetical protein